MNCVVLVTHPNTTAHFLARKYRPNSVYWPPSTRICGFQGSHGKFGSLHINRRNFASFFAVKEEAGTELYYKPILVQGITAMRNYFVILIEDIPLCFKPTYAGKRYQSVRTFHLSTMAWRWSKDRPQHVATVRYRYHIMLCSGRNKLFVLLCCILSN
jgi:hypothetical protein